jgi:hypothetical protein
MAVPRLQAAVLRLQLARHEAALEDHLEDSPPLLRMTMRPWRSALVRTPPPPFATLEVELEEGEEDFIAARMWLDPTVKPAGEARMALSRVTAGWLEQMTLEFVGKVLDRG